MTPAYIKHLRNLASYDYNKYIIIYKDVALSTIIHISIWVPPGINNLKGIGADRPRSHVPIHNINTDYGNTGQDRTF